jgi:hypothetical protein
MTYSSPCFSGQCGFCEGCCEHNNPIVSQAKELAMRAQDYTKFMGNKLVEEEHNKYSVALKKTMRKADYRNPTDIGYMSTQINYEKGQPLTHLKYKLNKEIHNEVCSDRLCQVFFHGSHEVTQKSYYSKLPVYTRMVDRNHNMCAVCIAK